MRTAACFLLLLLVLPPIPLWATPHAVVRIPSHGCSGTVIQTGEGYSYILSCAHAFPTLQESRKPIVLDAPCDVPAPTRKVGIKLLRLDGRDDLSLILLNYGPWPYVAPVAPKGFRYQRCLSVGYDEMQQPAKQRPARVVNITSQIAFTQERPWHGRSGGALLDVQTQQLVGVVSGYTGPKNRQEVYPGASGVYVSHSAILRFLTNEPPPGNDLCPEDLFGKR